MLVCLTYVFIVKVAGPKFMENRKPFELKQVLIWYNAFQVAFSTWLFYECLVSGWWGHYSLRCQPVDYSDSPLAMRMAHGCWWYYFSKFTEFFDTFFFVLRGHSSFFGLLNTFVHIIMYGYYLVAALGPQYQKFLWWKKYLTALQMVQFVCVFIHAFQLLFTDCNYPRAFVWWIGMHAVMFYFLFADFYKNAYKKKAARKAEADRKRQEELAESVKSNGTSNNGTAAATEALYQAPGKEMGNGYTAMRNRVYIAGTKSS
ncbi:hypothetical protein B566_EDAN015114 [Ephemera danica]|nr:hypothetical protein B566_EDAN015114 [Ephemera danica]